MTDAASPPPAAAPAASPRSAPARRRRLLWWAGGGAAALVLAIVLGEVMGWPFLRGPVQRALQRSAAVPVVLDSPFRVRLFWQPQVALGHLRIGAAPGVDVPYLVDATELELAWRWGDVWRWHRAEAPLKLLRLHASTLDAHLVRDGDGKASWQIGDPDKPRLPPDDDALARLPRMASLTVKNGHLRVDDRILETRLAVEMRGAEGQAIAAGQAGYVASAVGTYRALPLKLDLRAGAALPLLQDGDAAPPVPIRLEGDVGAARVLFDGSAAGLLGDWRIDGALRFRGPSLARVGEPLGITLPNTAPFDLSGRLSQADGTWHLRADKALIGRSSLNGDFSYDTRVRPGKLTGKLGGKLLALADLGPAVGTKLPGQAPPPVKPARVLPQRQFDLPSLNAMDADVQVSIDEFDLGSEALAPLRTLRTHLLLDDGVLQLKDLQAVVAGGQLTGTSQFDGSRANTAKWGADLRFRGVDIAGFVRGLRAPAAAASAAAGGAAAREVANTSNAKVLGQRRASARQGGDQPVRAYLTGEMAADVSVTGQGRSTAEILSTLQGRVQLSLRDGTMSHLITHVAGLDLAQALGVLVRGDEPLPLRCARVDLAVKQGVAVPQFAVLDNRDSTLVIDGHIDLRDESLALRAISRPKDVSPFSLRTPVTVTGTLSNPVVGLEGSRLAGRAAAALVLGAVAAPVAALLPFIDLGERSAGDPCEPPKPAAAPNGAAPKAGMVQGPAGPVPAVAPVHKR